MIAVIAVIVIIAVVLAVGLGSSYFQTGSSTTINEVCTIVSYTHSYPYNPENNSSYAFVNTTSMSNIETYTQSNISVQNFLQSVSTATGTTLTASGKPGISWNETVCSFFTSTP